MEQSSVGSHVTRQNSRGLGRIGRGVGNANSRGITRGSVPRGPARSGNGERAGGQKGKI